MGGRDEVMLRQYLPVVDHGDEILVGTMPPHALRIADPPHFLTAILRYLAVPRTRSETVAEIVRRAASTHWEGEQLLEDLMGQGIVVRGSPDAESRYARHLLYFDMLELEGAEAQQALADATVGLVGTGGIGTNLATTLAAAGVGSLVFSDGDTVELSNLTRQTLFDEGSVGKSKVEEAKQRLSRLNSDTRLHSVPSLFVDEGMLDEHFAGCNLVILSADPPPEGLAWLNAAAFRHGFAYSIAGYIENFGVVGPLVVPGETACSECTAGFTVEESRPDSRPATLLNPDFQAPSFGPLNALVAAMQANEAIRFLLGLSCRTREQRLIIDSASYEMHVEGFVRSAGCPKCGDLAAPPDHRPLTLAAAYEAEREEASQNALVLDELIARIAPAVEGTRVLDVGCGIGTDAIRHAAAGSTVAAIDVDSEMLAVARRRVADAELRDRVEFSTDLDAVLGEPFDLVLCLNVLDYLADPAPLLRQLRGAVGVSGQLIVALPHPVKDAGVWRRERKSGCWSYRHFELDGYFAEGEITKTQETASGQRVAELTYFHRTTAHWVNLFLESGFALTEMHEPHPDPAQANRLPALYERSSRVPYFAVFVLRPA